MVSNSIKTASHNKPDEPQGNSEDRELWLTIENTPEDRLDIIKKMEKLKRSIQINEESIKQHT